MTSTRVLSLFVRLHTWSLSHVILVRRSIFITIHYHLLQKCFESASFKQWVSEWFAFGNPFGRLSFSFLIIWCSDDANPFSGPCLLSQRCYGAMKDSELSKFLWRISLTLSTIGWAECTSLTSQLWEPKQANCLHATAFHRTSPWSLRSVIGCTRSDIAKYNDFFRIFDSFLQCNSARIN